MWAVFSWTDKSECPCPASFAVFFFASRSAVHGVVVLRLQVVPVGWRTWSKNQVFSSTVRRPCDVNDAVAHRRRNRFSDEIRSVTRSTVSLVIASVIHIVVAFISFSVTFLCYSRALLNAHQLAWWNFSPCAYFTHSFSFQYTVANLPPSAIAWSQISV